MLLKSSRQFFNLTPRILPFTFYNYSRKNNAKIHFLQNRLSHINNNLYHYAGNNPVKYTDPDGKCAKPAPMPNSFYGLLASRPDFDKSKVSVVIRRDMMDNGNNGFYYQSDLFLRYDGKTLASFNVQSTPDLSTNNTDKLAVGSYEATYEKLDPQKNKNTKFTTRIRIVADILIHPNVILNPFVRKEREENNKSNGPFNYPNSEGCQVLEDQDFSKLTGALDDLGFNSGDKIKVDVCEVTIRQGAINNE